MLTRRTLTPWLCVLLLSTAACDKNESLGMVDSEGESSDESDGEETSSVSYSGSGSDVVCQTDAMLCPDGSAVGRVGPDCEFAPCPGDSDTDGSGSDSDTDDAPPLPTCDPDQSYLEPASCPMDGPAQVVAGCYVECDPDADPDGCGEGMTCTAVQVDPCPCANDGGDCCGACAGEAFVCQPALDDVCAQVVGQEFESIEALECGISPDGIVPCNWNLQFGADGSFDWMYSDVGEAGTYACEDGELTVTSQPSYDVTYDSTTGVLEWDGVEYVATQ